MCIIWIVLYVHRIMVLYVQKILQMINAYLFIIICYLLLCSTYHIIMIYTESSKELRLYKSNEMAKNQGDRRYIINMFEQLLCLFSIKIYNLFTIYTI